MNDEVSQPAHYKLDDIECIDVMLFVFGRTAVRWYCVLNAFKYIWRHTRKGKEDQDLSKAIWYLRFAVKDDPRRDDGRQGKD